MATSRTLEIFGFLRGDPSLIKEDLRVRVLDQHQVDRTDTTETYLTQRVQGGIVYRVKAKGDTFFDTPTDTKDGLRDGESFSIVFDDLLAPDSVGQPARNENGSIIEFTFVYDVGRSLNVDAFLAPPPFTLTPAGGYFIDRPTAFLNTGEPGAKFLVTFGDFEPTPNGVGVTEVAPLENFVIDRDGSVSLRASIVDRFGNVSRAQSFQFEIEFPTVQMFELRSLKDISEKRAFYKSVYMINNETLVYTQLSEEETNQLIAEATEETLEDPYYVVIEPGIINGHIAGPRYVRLAANREGTIRYRTFHNGEPEVVQFVDYRGETLVLRSSLYVVDFEFEDTNGASTGVVRQTYRPLNYAPVIEQVTINDDTDMVFDRDIVVNILTSGTTRPQMITIGQNPILYPVVNDEPTYWDGESYYFDCQHLCNYGPGYGLGYGAYGNFDCIPEELEFGYGYGYDRRAFDTNFCFTPPEDACDTVVHTAFDTQVAFRLREENGEQCIYLRAASFTGEGFPTIKKCVQVLLDEPFITIDPVCSVLKQTSNKLTLTGTKSPNTSVYLNGEEIIEFTEDVTWSWDVDLKSGPNPFVMFVRDQFSRSSEPVALNVDYTFEFTGITEAIAKADGAGKWVVEGVGLQPSACDEDQYTYEIIAQIVDPCNPVESSARNVLILENSPSVNYVSPQIAAPVCETSQDVEFDYTLQQPLNYFGPYETTADDCGEWSIEDVILETSTCLTTTDPNVEIVVTSINQDGSEHTKVIPVQVFTISGVDVLLNGDRVAADIVPPFVDANCLTLQDLPVGVNNLRVIVRDSEGFVSAADRTFIVDNQKPVVTITSPTADQLVFSKEPPVLEYTVETADCPLTGCDQIPLMRLSVFVDGVDFGTIQSGEHLPKLANGAHIITVEAESMSRDEERIAPHGCDGYGYGCEGDVDKSPDGYGVEQKNGKVGSDSVSITYLEPIVVASNDVGDKQINIGNDIDGDLQANAIIEEMRVLNATSSDNEILQDYRLLLNGIRFQNRVSDPVLTAEQDETVRDLDLAAGRISLPTQTLLLMHFDNSIQSEEGIDNRPQTADGTILQDNDGNFVETNEDGLPLDLEVETGPIIDDTAAVNQLAIDVYVREGDNVDRDLILDSIDRVIPARAQALVVFEEVEE